MPSVIVNWTGTCPVRSRQEELVGFLQEVARRSAAWQEKTPPEPAQAAEANDGEAPAFPSPRTPVRLLDQEITGRIMLGPSLVNDQDRAAEEMERTEFPRVEIPPSELDRIYDREAKPSLYLCPTRLRVYGIDFELFDPPRLYDECRMSFVFLECPDLAVLNGCVGARSMIEMSAVSTLMNRCNPLTGWFARQESICAIAWKSGVISCSVGSSTSSFPIWNTGAGRTCRGTERSATDWNPAKLNAARTPPSGLSSRTSWTTLIARRSNGTRSGRGGSVPKPRVARVKQAERGKSER